MNEAVVRHQQFHGQEGQLAVVSVPIKGVDTLYSLDEILKLADNQRIKDVTPVMVNVGYTSRVAPGCIFSQSPTPSRIGHVTRVMHGLDVISEIVWDSFSDRLCVTSDDFPGMVASTIDATTIAFLVTVEKVKDEDDNNTRLHQSLGRVRPLELTTETRIPTASLH